MIGIYKYQNKTNGKIYIGRSIDIARRKKEHLSNPSPYSYFDNTINKIGEDCFDFEIVEECKEEELKEKEKYWIKYYHCCVKEDRDKGYNLTYGGEEYKSENNPWAVLTQKQVEEIIDKLINTNISITQLAKDYSVHYNTISNINCCKTWYWLHDYIDNIRLETKGHNQTSGEMGTNIITEEQAKQVIKALEDNKVSQAQISRDLNISLNIVYDINRCRTWKYLHNYKKNIRNEYNKGGCQ